MRHFKYFDTGSNELPEKLSKLVFQLSYPSDIEVTSTHLFGWKDSLIEIPIDFEFRVYYKPIVMLRLKSLLKELLTPEEEQRITNILQNEWCILGDIIPNTFNEVQLSIEKKDTPI